MRRRPWVRAGWALLTALQAAGCAVFPSPMPDASAPAPALPASPPPAREEAPQVPAASGPPRRAAVVARERAAEDLQRRGDLARALVAWKILELLEPDNPEHAQREEEVRREARRQTAEHLTRGDDATARGDGDAAAEEYLRALALSPLDPTPADRLRDLERRQVRGEEDAKVRRLSRKTASPPLRAAAPASRSAEAGYYLETGVTLLRQGEYEAAAVEIGKYLGAVPDDRRARQLLAEAREKQAEDLYQRGLRASRADLSKAIDLWRQCLALNPNHVGARSQLDKAVRVQERLRGIR